MAESPGVGPPRPPENRDERGPEPAPAPAPETDKGVVRFESIPIVRGPLFDLEKKRPELVREVADRTTSEFRNHPKDLMLGEALYSERRRLQRFKKLDLSAPFILKRHRRDKKVWRHVQRELLRSPAEGEREQVFRRVVEHYADEIGGHFDPKVYWLATRLVPFGFSWLLNAASMKRFLPWGMTRSLQERIRIHGEIGHLQKLARKGTILLVPTHQSNIDSVLIGYVIYLMGLPPFAYGAGLNLFTNPLLSFFMSNLGAYTVDRAKTNEIYKNVLKHYSTRILEEGMHSIFFPGGGRSRSGALESHLKLGLLGTGLKAQVANLRQGKENPNVYVVPMVMSYHFVFEASSLIEQYLEGLGGSRFLGADIEGTGPLYKVLHFFWKFFSSPSRVECRVGRPLDIFGNFVDEDGRSYGPNGTTIDVKRWLTTRGELRADEMRDREYTRELGDRLVERYHRENTVLTSHLAAFTFVTALRKKYPELDLYRFLRLSKAQRSLPYERYLQEAKRIHERVREAHRAGELFLSEELLTDDTESWVRNGIRYLGYLHDLPVLKVEDGVITTGDMNLLYYYRNRLAGYGLTLYGERGPQLGPGEMDEQGFLA